MFAEHVRREPEHPTTKPHVATRSDVPTKRRAKTPSVPGPSPVPAPAFTGGETPWPRSTRIVRRSDATIHRKTLKGAGLDTGLTETGETRAVVGAPVEGGGLPGKVYANPAIGKAADKASALKAAAVAAGAIGTRLDTWGRAGKVGKRPKKPWTPPQMFTRDDKEMNTATVATVDPFFHRVTVPYTIADVDHTLVLEYQHAASHQGYISSVIDSASEPIKGGASMYHGKSNKKAAVDYSTQHAPLEGNLLGATAGSGEGAVDAYTKLAAEGARWVCVRDNIAKLEDTSLFYCTDKTNPNQVLTVQFLELWVSWADRFDKKYDIPNSKVITELRSGKLGQPEPIAELDPVSDVNLEA